MEKVDRRCPQCGNPELLFWDDPNQEGWGRSGEWKCEVCDYYATDDQIDIDEFFEDDDFDDFDDDDVDDYDEGDDVE